MPTSFPDKLLIFYVNLEKTIAFLVCFSNRDNTNISRVFEFFFSYKTSFEFQELSEMDFLRNITSILSEFYEGFTLSTASQMTVHICKSLIDFCINFFLWETFSITVKRKTIHRRADSWVLRDCSLKLFVDFDLECYRLHNFIYTFSLKSLLKQQIKVKYF